MATLETQETVGEITPIENRAFSFCTLRTLLTRVVGIAAAVAFVLLALIPDGATQIYQWPWSLSVSLLALVPITLFFLHGVGRKTRLGMDADLLIALLAFAIVISALSSRFSTQSLDVSLIALGMLATIPWMAAIVASDQGHAPLRLLQKGIGWFGFVFALYSLLGWTMQTLQWEALHVHAINLNAGETLVEWNPFNYRNEFPLGHGNYTAGLTLLLLPWIIGLAIAQRGAKRVFWMIAAGLVGFVLFTAGSRGALLGVGAVMAGFLALLAIRRTIRLKLLISLGLIGAIGLSVFAFSQPRVRHLLQSFSQSGELNPGDIQRWSMLEAGWHMGADHPFLGQGPGVTPLTYPSYRAELDGGVESALQLHSTPVQIWADLGTTGLILTLALGMIIIRRLWFFALQAESGSPPSPSGIAIGSAALSMTGYLAFSLTDFQLDIPVFAGFVGINLGVILGGTRTEGYPSPHLPLRVTKAARALIPAAAILLLLPVLWSAGHETLARRAHSGAVDRLERGDTPGFEVGIAKAMHWSPTNAFYPTSGALGMLRLSYQTTDPTEIARIEAKSAGYFLDSLARNADQEIAHFNLGWLLLEADPAAAESHFRQAAALVPDKGGVYLGRGLACFEQGDEDGALTGWALEIVNDPKFALAPFWDIPAFSTYRQPAMEAAIAILENESDAGVSSSDTAVILGDLLTEGPPSAATEARSARAMVLAGMKPEERRHAIEMQMIRGRGNRATEEEIEPILALFERHGNDLKAILNDPAGREAPLIRQTRRERPGFGILMRNLDVPLPLDAYIVQENGIVLTLFPALFPAKGYLPTPLLVKMAAINPTGGRIP